ncbi:F-box domain containing protein [Tanacetum coccineum]
MDGIPSNIIFDIFSRLPARCLARSRYVSTIWCKYINDRYLTIIHDKRLVEEPTPILYHQHLCIKKITLSLCFHVTESKQAGTADLVFKPTKGSFLEFIRKKPLSRSSVVRIEARGSCDGLICLSQDDGHVITLLVVIHPLRKECYELPRIPLCFENHMRRESCGLGFDAFTNTYKMVCVLLKEYAPPNKPDIYSDIKTRDGGREVIWFDVNKEEFGGRPVIWFDVEKEEFWVIDPPNRTCDLWRRYGCYYDHLVDLNGEFGYACCRTMEVWVLDKQKEWVPHCRFEKETVPDGYIDVIGCWNKDGDILIKCMMRDNGRDIFFVNNLKSGVLHKTNVACSADGPSPDIFMYPNTVSSTQIPSPWHQHKFLLHEKH